MTPIKLDRFLSDTTAQPKTQATVELTKLGMFHAAPTENGRPILALRFDPKSGRLIPTA